MWMFLSCRKVPATLNRIYAGAIHGKQAPNLATAERIFVGSWVYLTCGGVFQMGTVSRIKDGEVHCNQSALQSKD